MTGQMIGRRSRLFLAAAATALLAACASQAQPTVNIANLPVQPGATEGDCVSATWENPLNLNRNRRACNYKHSLRSHPSYTEGSSTPVHEG